ncbi:MAG: Cupin 2 conserved barrel domain protein [Anaerocolumna sp.]|jgi:quercetin dioxygenase-like cupin family protein|nr:Cupin 2 conserved barrel domain protein [Anaerocolumna sp.]
MPAVKQEGAAIAQGYIHSHPHLQTTYIVKGSFEFTIDGVKTVVKAGDSLLMPSNSVHGTAALEDSVLVDVFNPKKDDFLK